MIRRAAARVILRVHAHTRPSASDEALLRVNWESQAGNDQTASSYSDVLEAWVNRVQATQSLHYAGVAGNPRSSLSVLARGAMTTATPSRRAAVKTWTATAAAAVSLKERTWSARN